MMLSVRIKIQSEGFLAAMPLERCFQLLVSDKKIRVAKLC